MLGTPDDTSEDLNERVPTLPYRIKYDDERSDKGPDHGDYYPYSETSDIVDRGSEEERKWDQDGHNHGLKDKSQLVI